MARIRSIHPGLFTDEAFVELSADAQVFYIGILTQCDDQGVFEWKPGTLRMLIRPTKDGSVEPLLAELAGTNHIKGYEIRGRKFGAVRNFCKYQRPRKPNRVHPLPDELRTYVAPTDDSTEPDVDEGGSSTEIPPQMERRGEKEEGGRGEKGKARAPTASPPKAYAFHGKVIRLNEQDLERWRKSFKNIRNLESELESLDAWHAKNGTGSDWFQRVAAALAKKDRESAEGGGSQAVGGDDPQNEAKRRFATEIAVFRSGRWDDRYPDRPKPGQDGCLWPEWLQREELGRKGKAA